MADEPKIEEISSKSSKEGGAEGKPSILNNPWLPLLTIVILIPLLTIVLWKFIMLPDIEKARKDYLSAFVSSGQMKSTDSSPSANGSVMQKYEFKSVLANLNEGMQNRYIKISFQIEGGNPDFLKKIEEAKIKLQDATMVYLSSLKLADLDQPGSRNVVRADLLNALNNVLGNKLIEGLYFSEFVVQ